jgi:uncharacterized protein (TIGR02246 family)
MTAANPTDTRVEVEDWYRRSCDAWLAGDADTIAEMTDRSLYGRMVMMDGVSEWEPTWEADLDGIRSFLAYAATHDVQTEFELYDIVFRSPDEAVLSTRKTVTIRDGADARVVTQFAIETVRRANDGRWRLARYWAEKARHG